MNIVRYVIEVWKGKDIYRILMNNECAHHQVSGMTIDVGSGLTKASYHRFLQCVPGTQITPLDLRFAKNAGGHALNLESDPLPYENESVDTVLVFNLLEHVFNYTNVLREVYRVLKPGGTLVGAVPFLVGYHADPHDYWRYTHETLQRIFSNVGFSSVTIVPFGRGPFTAAFAQQEIVWPRVLKLIAGPLALLLDDTLCRLVPSLNQKKFALGYFFRVKR